MFSDGHAVVSGGEREAILGVESYLKIEGSETLTCHVVTLDVNIKLLLFSVGIICVQSIVSQDAHLNFGVQSSFWLIDCLCKR